MPSRLSFPRHFWLYLVGRFCAGTAMTLLRAAVAWHVFALTHSAFHLGLVGLVQFAPALVLSLVAGAVADTQDRLRIMRTAQSFSLAVVTVLTALTARGSESVAIVYGTVFLVAIATAFDNPARSALLPTLVTREAFPRAVSIAATNQAVAFVTGPAVGGIVIAEIGVAGAYGAYALLLAVSFTLLGFVPRRPREGAVPPLSFRLIREGLAFVRSRQVLLGCMTLDMFAVIFGGATAMLPIYAAEILEVGPHGYGLLAASLDLGALLASGALIWLPPIRNAGRALLVSVTIFGVATIVFGLSRSFPLSVAAYMIAGMADQVSVVLRITMIQLATPDELRGRVSSVNMLFIGASNQLGAVESGFVAALTTPTFSVVSGGVGCLVVVAVVALGLEELRRYRIQPLAV